MENNKDIIENKILHTKEPVSIEAKPRPTRARPSYNKPITKAPVLEETRLKPIRVRYEESIEPTNVEIIGLTKRKRSGFSDAEINQMRLRDREPIKCIPQNIEYPGRNLEFYFNKYKEDPLEKFNLKDGVEVMLPRGVVHMLIERGQVDSFVFFKDSFTGKTHKRSKKIRRFSAQASGLLEDMRAVKQERGF